MIFSRQGEAAGEKNHHFAARNGAQIFCEAANSEQHSARAKIRRGISQRGHANRWHGIGHSIGHGVGSHGDVRRRRVGIDGRTFHAGDGGAEQDGAGGEVLDDAKRAAKIHDGHQAVRAGVRFDEFLGCAARLDLVGRGHGGIVEEENQVMALAVRLRNHFGAGRETGNRLFFVVFKNFEIVLREIVDVVSLFVGHYGVDEHQLCFFLDDRGGLLVRGSRRLRRRRRWWRRLLRADANSSGGAKNGGCEPTGQPNLF